MRVLRLTVARQSSSLSESSLIGFVVSLGLIAVDSRSIGLPKQSGNTQNDNRRSHAIALKLKYLRLQRTESIAQCLSSLLQLLMLCLSQLRFVRL